MSNQLKEFFKRTCIGRQLTDKLSKMSPIVLLGGTVMEIGLGLYGLLMFIAAEEIWRHAIGGKMDLHQAWALRL